MTIAVEATSLRIGLLYDDSLDHHGGVTQYVMMLARALRGAGHEVCLLVGESSVDVGDGCPVHALAHNMPVRFNGSTHSMPVFSRAHRIQRLLETHAFDVIHVQVPYSPLLSGRVISRLSARTALIGTFHVASERTLPRVGARALSALTWRTLKRFDKILSVSKCAARFAADTYGLESTLVIPNMVDVENQSRGRRLVSPAAGCPAIVFLGALVPRKGPDHLIEAFALVHKVLPAASLSIAGEGPMLAALQCRVRRHGLVSAVFFHGRVSERQKISLLGSADIACFPSRYGESFGVVLLEAIAAGAGVVLAGKNAGYSELFADQPCTISDTCPEQLARRLLELSDPNVRLQLRSGQRALLARHDSRIVAERLVDLYRRAIAERHASPQAARTFPPGGLQPVDA